MNKPQTPTQQTKATARVRQYHAPSGRWRLGFLLALTTAVMWGLLPIALKGVLTALDATTITWYRFLVSAVVVGGVYCVRGGFQGRLLLKPRLAILMIGAILGLLSNYWLYLVGLDLSTAEASQMMIQLAPVLLLVLSLWVHKEPFSRWQLLGIATLLTGMALFFNLRWGQFAEEIGSGGGRYTLGLAYIILAAILWAFYGLAQKELLKNFGSQEVLVIIYVAGSIVFLPWSAPSDVFQMNTSQWFYLIFACINTVIAYGAFAFALEHWEASRVSATVTIVPILTLCFVSLFSWLVPGSITPEPMNGLGWFGAMLVVAGAMTTALVRSK